MKSYEIGRNPLRGGLCFTKMDANFDQKAKGEIEDSCMELIAKDMDTPCVAIYSLTNGEHVVSLAVKTNGTRCDPRPHEVTHGILLENSDELLKFCNSYMTDEENMRWVFFPNGLDMERGSDWTFSNEFLECDDHAEFLDKYSTKLVLNLTKALKVISEQKMKIQLLIPDGHKMEIAQLLCYLMCDANLKLSIVVNGECTSAPPSILMNDEPKRQDMRGYQKMSWDELISLGAHFSPCKAVRIDPVESKENKEAGAFVNCCMEYLEDSEITDYDLLDKWNEISENPEVKRRAIRKLRKKLAELPNRKMKKCEKRYMNLLCFSYREKEAWELDVTLHSGIPYDTQGILEFLEGKAGTKRELEDFNRMLYQWLLTR